MKLFAKGKGQPDAQGKAPGFSPIDRVGLLGLLNQVVNNGQSGVLELREPRGEWVYAFQAGALTHAAGGRIRAARQAFDLLWEFQSGEFKFTPGTNPSLAGNLYIDKARLLDLLRRSQAALQGPSAPYIPPDQQRPIAPYQTFPQPVPGQAPPGWQAQPGPPPGQYPAALAQGAPQGWPPAGQPGMPPAGQPGMPPAPAWGAGGYPQQPGYPAPAYPQQGAPYPGAQPQQGQPYPPQAYPGQPQPGYPAYPQQPMPQQGMQQQRMPQQGMPLPMMPPVSPPPPAAPTPPTRPITPQSFSVPPMAIPKKRDAIPSYQPPAAPVPAPAAAAPEPPKAPADDLAALRASLVAQAPPLPAASTGPAWGVRTSEGTVAPPAVEGPKGRGKDKGTKTKSAKTKGDSKLKAAIKVQLITFLLWACERRYSPDDHWTLKDAFEVSTMELRDQFIGAFSQLKTPKGGRPAEDDDMDDMAAGRMRGRGRRH